MPDYTIEIKAPEKMDLTITGEVSQQLALDKGKFNQVTFDYDGDSLIFQGKKIQFVASLKCISDVFWMILSMAAKGFEVKPNEPRDILKKVLKSNR